MNNIVSIGVNLSISKDTEITLNKKDYSDSDLLQAFYKTDHYLHIKKVLKSIGFYIDDVVIYEV